MTSRNLALTLAFVFVAVTLVWSFAGCSFPAFGLPPDNAGIACLNDAQCDDMNACTDDACPEDSKHCLNLARPDMSDSPAQTPGDCHKIVCVGGKEESVIDTDDIQDDANDCSTDTCDAAGKPGHTAKPDETPCKRAGQDGECDAFAECKIICGSTLPPCDDGKPCTMDSCNAATSKCDFTSQPDGVPTPGVMQVAGDCHVHQCIGGMDNYSVDDSDLPVTTSDCVIPTCTSGAPTEPNKSTGTMCNTLGGKFCDGKGACVECNGDVDCPGPTDDCQHPQCAANTCVTYHTPVNTPISAGLQVPGDCHVIVCDGNGGQQVNIDDTDIEDDAKDCTTDTCAGGMIFHTNKPLDTSCGVGGLLFCDGKGACLGCNGDNNCQAPQTCGPMPCGVPNVCACCPQTCAQQGIFCGLATNLCGMTIQCNDNTKDAGETDVDCGGPSCSVKCAQGKQCTANSDCLTGFCADGVCCNAACNGFCEACTTAKKGGGQNGTCGAIGTGLDPDAECADQGQMSCGTDGSCDGAGACRFYATGSVCQAASCASGTTVNVPDTCSAAHTCADNGTLSCGNFACLNSACKLTCAGDADCAATAYCGAPICLLKKANGVACGGANQCQSGNCVDGVCCNTTCTGICNACNVPGNLGTCSNVLANTPDPVTCSAPNNVCNGMGACKKVNGQTCGVGGECFSASCVDGYCCDTACAGTCKACNVAGKLGICSNVVMGQTDTGTCPAPNVCDGAGSCLKPNGQMCGAGTECQSTFCADGVCCSAACTGTCQACDLGGTVGTCTNIPKNGTDMVPACSGAQACDGNGLCKKVNGQGCGSAGQCVSGFCPTDGICCDAMCDGPCVSCGSGTCGNVMSGMTDDTCTAPYTCDGASHCQKPFGDPCMLNIDCQGGQCVDGVCCNSACTGVCQSCAILGTLGTCSNIPAGGIDASPVCGGAGDMTHACNGGTACLLVNGELCTNNNQCVSDNCTGNPKMCQP